MLDALTADPTRTLGRTTVEADDEYHARTANAENARFRDLPYGLGPRVPLYAISPWSTGGFVASEVFNHTSMIRFLETRFGVMAPNISARRRAVCGDLTSCFDFAAPDDRGFVAHLPATREPAVRAAALKEVAPPLPATLAPPVQERGLHRRRAVPYRLDAHLVPVTDGFAIELANRSAERAAVFHLYRTDAPDRVLERYTVGAGATVRAPIVTVPGAPLDLLLLGPAGFHRRFAGKPARLAARMEGGSGPAALVLVNHGDEAIRWSVRDLAYGAPGRRSHSTSARVTAGTTCW